MFRKDFFGIYHGSISAKTESHRFLINTKEAIFDALDDKDLIEWINRTKKLANFDKYYIEPKFDGASLNLIYENKKLNAYIASTLAVSNREANSEISIRCGAHIEHNHIKQSMFVHICIL